MWLGVSIPSVNMHIWIWMKVGQNPLEAELMHIPPVLSGLSTVLFIFSPLPNNSHHMGCASASQLLNYKHSFDCKLNGRGCQLSLSSCGHTTRAPAIKNWHSCSERHRMLLLLAEQYLTLALLTPLLSQWEDCKDKSLAFECEFTSRHVSALIHSILFPLKEVKICLGRWLSVVSFKEDSLT